MNGIREGSQVGKQKDVLPVARLRLIFGNMGCIADRTWGIGKDAGLLLPKRSYRIGKESFFTE